jgi:sugar lactone lactonase YvrE
MDVLCSDLGLVESPRWHDGRLWFSDWIAGKIIAVDDEGEAEVVVSHASLPLCFDFLPDGRPLLVSNQAMALLAVEDDGRWSATPTCPRLRFRVQRHCRHGRETCRSGNFRFTAGPPEGPVQPGFVALVTPGARRGSWRRSRLPERHGCLCRQRHLVVADSYRHELVGFDIGTDGTLSGRRVWAELGEAAPDGICLDADGAAWYADVPHQHCVRVAEGGAVLDTVPLDRGGFACMLGGRGGTSLYIVAARWPGMAGLGGDAPWEGQVVRTEVAVPGAGWPARDDPRAPRPADLPQAPVNYRAHRHVRQRRAWG